VKVKMPYLREFPPAASGWHLEAASWSRVVTGTYLSR